SYLLHGPVAPFYIYFASSGDHRDLHSFPTRRSSDLTTAELAVPAPAPPAGLSIRGVEFAYGKHQVLRGIDLDVAPGTLCALLGPDRKSTRLNSSHVKISYAVFCLKKKMKQQQMMQHE